MAVERKHPDVPERATQALTRPTTVPLNEFVLRPEMYCHRDPEDLTNRDRLLPLMDSLTIEGQLNPVEFFREPEGKHGKPVVTKGHRRISALRQLARENRPGFTETMPVDSIEVVNASPQDLLCRSAADNANRKDLTLAERIRAAKALHDGEVEANRAAYALNYSVKQYLRDLRIARHAWMLSYVEHDDIGHTAAGDLLEAAENTESVSKLKDHLAEWLAAKREEVGEDKKLKGFLTKALSDHWITSLREQKPLDDKVVRPPQFQASIDADANLITVEGKLDLLKAPLSTLESAEHKLAAMQKVVAQYLKARGAVEGPQGPQDLAREEAGVLELLDREPEKPPKAPGEG
jgi:hypothetical protein